MHHRSQPRFSSAASGTSRPRASARSRREAASLGHGVGSCRARQIRAVCLAASNGKLLPPPLHVAPFPGREPVAYRPFQRDEKNNKVLSLLVGQSSAAQTTDESLRLCQHIALSPLPPP
jgi:hypothetical protein